MSSNVVSLEQYRSSKTKRRPPRPPGNEKARDFELIAMVSAIPYAARRHLSEWDRNYIRILSTDDWYRGRWAKLTPKQRKHCWRIIAVAAGLAVTDGAGRPSAPAGA
jgi:hypothetical protein